MPAVRANSAFLAIPPHQPPGGFASLRLAFTPAMEPVSPSVLWTVCYIIVNLGLSLFGIHRYSLIWGFWKNRKHNPQPKEKFSSLPPITIQLPIFNELNVARRLIEKVAELDYPKHLLQIQVLDDSTDETQEICRQAVAEQKAQGFDIEYIRRTDRTGFKAGALEAAMPLVKSDLIYILDADFIPPSGVLHEMVHFFTEDRVAMVQSRWGHLNQDYSLLTKIQGMYMDGHLVVEQTGRCRTGKYFNFNGTAGMWRKQAITDSGGWQHDTLTEDLDLSYRAQMRDWQFVYLVDVVTPAELPADMDGFKSQQHRWTKGSIQVCKKLLKTVWQADIPLSLKLESTMHLCTNFAYLLLVLLCILVWPDVGQATVKGPHEAWSIFRLWLLDIPIFFFTTGSMVVFYLVAQHHLDPKNWWKRLIYVPALLALGVGMSINNGKAVLEALFNQQSPFVRTPKYGIQAKGTTVKPKANYKALKSMVVGIEIISAIYFTGLTIYYMLINNWISVFFMGIFMLGFWYVALGSRLPQFTAKNLSASA
jgi:cellulose synthase/poly-beta-1,6-N-acetylglucosamine synthase-like glycosyltransferase